MSCSSLSAHSLDLHHRTFALLLFIDGKSEVQKRSSNRETQRNAEKVEQAEKGRERPSLGKSFRKTQKLRSFYQKHNLKIGRKVGENIQNAGNEKKSKLKKEKNIINKN